MLRRNETQITKELQEGIPHLGSEVLALSAPKRGSLPRIHRKGILTFLTLEAIASMLKRDNTPETRQKPIASAQLRPRRRGCFENVRSACCGVHPSVLVPSSILKIKYGSWGTFTSSEISLGLRNVQPGISPLRTINICSGMLSWDAGMTEQKKTRLLPRTVIPTALAITCGRLFSSILMAGLGQLQCLNTAIWSLNSLSNCLLAISGSRRRSDTAATADNAAPCIRSPPLLK